VRSAFARPTNFTTTMMTYRADIDGLRAVAVAGVVMYHAKLGVPGGYAGVDVFFVISGFLITSLILRDLRAGNFSLLNFWERRARRILPALAVVVAFTLIAGWFLLLPEDYALLAARVGALLGFAANLKFWLEAGYFTSGSEVNPLLHTWTLSLEEQYYILIPLFLGLLFRLRRAHWVLPLLWIGALLSLGAGIVGSHQNPSAAFYLLPSRAWELAAGSMLAFASPIASLRVRSTLGWLGLSAILAGFFYFNETTLFPGIPALLPVLGAAMIIWSGMPHPDGLQTGVYRLLTLQPLVGLGLISYSFYLWHWPLLAGYRYYAYEPSLLGLRLALVALALGFAWLSWRFVEQPFRGRSLVRSRKEVLALSTAIIAILAFMAGLIWKNHGFHQRLSPLATRFASTKDDGKYLFSHSLADVPNNLVQEGVGTSTSGVFVWGDSHAAAALQGIAVACRNARIPVSAAFSSSTAPVLDWYRYGRFGLNEAAIPYNAAVLAHIQSEVTAGRLSCIILAARWSSYITDKQAGSTFAPALGRTLNTLQRTGCKIIVIQEAPFFENDVPRTLALHCTSIEEIPHFAMSEKSYADRVHAQAQLFAKHPNLIVFNPASGLTDSAGHILPGDSQGAFFRDSHHLSTHGSEKVFQKFATYLPR
jgi:peptidoglycan/LPS O-acetylase OafA/YrhL